MSEISRSERVAGGIWGLLIGDAIGVPFEFKLPSQLPPPTEIDILPPSGFPRSHPDVPPGTWSDDGAHALCLLASLLFRRALDVEDLMRRMTNWYEHGYMAVDGQVFDVGVQTSHALNAFQRGTPAVECGSTDVHANGNGSLMRVLPLALWHRGSDGELIRDAFRQSRITHGHPRAQVCCALYCLWARALLAERDHPWEAATQALRCWLSDGTVEQAELEFHIRPDDDPSGTGSGYVVDCLRSAQVAMREASYRDVVCRAISFGRDTDTTAAVAGGLAGLRVGLRGIPTVWYSALRGKDLVAPLVEDLLTRLDEP